MDIQTIRAKFPALDKEQVFFDNAGGSQVLGSVVDSYVNLCLNTTSSMRSSIHEVETNHGMHLKGYETTSSTPTSSLGRLTK